MIRTLLFSLLAALATSCGFTVNSCDVTRPASGGAVSVADAVTCACSTPCDPPTSYEYIGTGLVPWVGLYGTGSSGLVFASGAADPSLIGATTTITLKVG